MFKELQSQRLSLRKLKRRDWEAVSFLRSDPEVNRLVVRPSAETKEDALAFIEKISRGIREEEIFYWAISLKGKEEMVGSICLWNFSVDRLKTEVGYDLHPAFYRKGIMDEAMKKVMSFGFEVLGVKQIEAFTHRDNVGSRRLLEKNDFRWNEARKDQNQLHNVIYEIKK
ncbi:MAG: GNAT family N-acetyltransferase [Bacteroidia bacterium]|nr:GNAT family N-acetyltransferase [Bacteroidia bacterium]